jgi:hypothetical protein
MNIFTLNEMFGYETKIQIPRSIWFPTIGFSAELVGVAMAKGPKRRFNGNAGYLSTGRRLPETARAARRIFN